MSVHADGQSIRTPKSQGRADDAVSESSIAEMVDRVFAVGDATLEGTLRRLAVLASETIAGADMVAITTLLAGRPRTAGFSEDLASEVDDLQRQSGIGPGLDAIRRQEIVRFDSAEKDYRWPAFNRAAAARGILSSLSVPLVVHHQGIGALHCYARTGAAFSAADERTASALAAVAAVALVGWNAASARASFPWALQGRSKETKCTRLAPTTSRR